MAVYIRKQPLVGEDGRAAARRAPSDTAATSIKRISPDPVVFDDNRYMLIVSDAADACRKRGHPVERVTGVLVSLDGKPVRLPVDYCQKCKKYFVSAKAYAARREAHGPLLGRYKFPRTGGVQEGRFSSLAEESGLKRYGYTVSRTDDLKMGQRRLILASLMDRRVVSKMQIERYLEFDIKNARKRTDRKRAVERWSSDLEWVRNYSIDQKRRFLVDTYKTFRL